MSKTRTPKQRALTVGQKRLLKLADALPDVPRQAFDMRMWERKCGLAECGFAGCTIGHAIHLKLFKGLTFDHYNRPSYKRLIGFRAVERLFQIDETETGDLFLLGPNNNTPKQVSRNIRAFVKRKRKAT